LKVLPYRHHPKYKFVLDLRAFGKGRKFFKTRTEADAERLRQITLLERHIREAIDLLQREMSDFITAGGSSQSTVRLSATPGIPSRSP